MTLRSLKIFLAVCENNNHISKAAESLYMTQPAVTAAIKEIEDHYGIKLFDRINRKLYLTESGKLFLQYASRISSLWTDMDSEMSSLYKAGAVRVGASMTIGSRFMPDYAKVFSEKHPEASLKVTIDSSDYLVEKLKKNELDIALVETKIHDESLITEAYMDDSLTIVTPPSGPFFKGYIFEKEEFYRQRFLLRERGSGTRELFEDIVSPNEHDVNIIWESSSTDALISAVSRGLGISVLPLRLVQKATEEGMLFTAEVKGFDFRRKFSVVYHRDKHLTELTDDFISICRNTVN
jgi:DNA-binding transcriptional LysR family regulator